MKVKEIEKFQRPIVVIVYHNSLQAWHCMALDSARCDVDNFLRVNNMGDQAWKKFKSQMKNKRTSKGKEKANKCFLSTGELTIQRLSNSVSGKAQKYS